MSKIELIITHTWDIKNNYINGTCGHTYEVIDYMWKLKDVFDVKIIIPELNIEDILTKYNFTLIEKNFIKSIIIPRSNIIRTKGIVLITDGNLANFKVLIKAKAIVQFMCGINDTGFNGKEYNLLNKTNSLNNIFNLGDKRIYDNNLIHFDYNKKILFSKIKYGCLIGNYTNMFYLTKNCRSLNKDYLINLFSKYDNSIVFTDFPLQIEEATSQYNFNLKIINIKEPVNIFDYSFKNYIYTPVERKFDCSSRLIPECKYSNIEVDTSLIDYDDNGLYTRLIDSINSIDSIDLNKDNNIIKILKLISEIK